MPRDYSEAYLELNAIRKEMADIDPAQHPDAILQIAAAVRVLAWHISELIQDL